MTISTVFQPEVKMVIETDPKTAMRYARNAKAWALGDQKRNGFHVRRVVWGLLMANMERRPGEEIRRAVILVGGKRASRS